MLRPARIILGATLLVSTVVFLWFSRAWPLVGDASLIHYLCFMMDHGFRPYRDLGDMNMPGSFLIEWSVMHTLGGGAVAWRIFDVGLLGIAAAAMFAIAHGSDPHGKRWFPGLFAACLFALVHGRDGFGQSGQRDLTMAVALLTATAFLFVAVRHGLRAKASPFAAGAFGLAAGVAATIKPTAVPLGLVLFALALLALRRGGRPTGGFSLAAAAGYMAAPAVSLAFLLHEGALGAFLESVRILVPYYQSLGHRTAGYLLLHSVSPLLAVVALWSAAMTIEAATRRGSARPEWIGSWERVALGCGVCFGLLSYLFQARGFPYYRYPLLIFLLPLMGIDLEVVWERTVLGEGYRLRTAAGWLAATAMAVGALIIAPTSAVLISRYDPTNLDFITSLEAQLEGLGGAQLSGEVQCIDSIQGCGTTLYRMRLVQATGVLSDFLLFGPARISPGADLGAIPIVKKTRAQLMDRLETSPPLVLVITSSLHIDGPDGYAKLGRWPAFERVLEQRYAMVDDWRPTRPTHWWSRPVWPSGYRIYRLRGTETVSRER